MTETTDKRFGRGCKPNAIKLSFFVNHPSGAKPTEPTKMVGFAPLYPPYMIVRSRRFIAYFARRQDVPQSDQLPEKH
jgi:hypothetical protein